MSKTISGKQILKGKNKLNWKRKNCKKTAKKRQHKVETDSEEEKQEEKDEAESEPEEIREDTLKKPKTLAARKIKEETKKRRTKAKQKKRSKIFLNVLTKTKKCSRKLATM